MSDSPNIDASKPTILVCSDSAASHSGLGRITRTVFNHLADTGRYNIIQLGWFHHGHTSEKVRFPIIPTKTGRKPDGSIDESDRYGILSFPEVLREFDPDIVWVCADPWHLLHYTDNPQRGRYYLVGYTAIDSPPISYRDREILNRFDVVVPYCAWAASAMEKAGISTGTDPVLHGVDTSTFKILDEGDRTATRRTMGIREDEFLFVTVARNISRKYLAALFPVLYYLKTGNYIYCKNCGSISLFPYDSGIRAPTGVLSACERCKSSNVVQGTQRENIRWYYHGALKERMGWNLEELRDRYKLQDTVIFNSKLQVTAGVPDHELNLILNAGDAFILPTTAEGFGLPVLEAMAAGLPCILTDTTAYKEWAHPGAVFIEKGYTHIEHGLNLERVLPSWEDMVSKMLMVMDDRELREKLVKGGQEVARSLDWNKILPAWEKVFDRVMERKQSMPWARVQAL